MRLAIFMFLFVAVQGDWDSNYEPTNSINDINFLEHINNERTVEISKLYDANTGIYHPPVHDREAQSTFWRNYGIRFVIGAAVSTIICLIIVVIRLCKQSKKDTDTNRLINRKDDLV